MIIESEKTLERKLSAEIKKLGGMAVKLAFGGFSGLPDRICLLPGGIVFFVEVKTTGKKATKLQIFMHKKLRKLDFEVYVVDKSEQIKRIIKEYGNIKANIY